MSTSARETSSPAAAALPIGISKLAAAGPAPEFEDKLTLFGRLVGSWDVVNVVLNEDDGTAVHESRGEWHFFWILGGRGIRDVLYAVGWSPDRFGSTYRCYDAEADLWRCTWMTPAGGEYVNLVAREVDTGIELIGHGPDPTRIERWTFSEITEDSFLWRGEVSRDDGQTWRLIQEMHATRQASADP
jgi:hypothetical protein